MLLFGHEPVSDMVYSLPNPENSRNNYNAASSQQNPRIMLIIACIGVPSSSPIPCASTGFFAAREAGPDDY